MRRRRRGWEHATVGRSLRAAGLDELADEVQACGKLSVWTCGACGDQAARRQVISCKSRVCPYCLHARAQRIARRLTGHVCKFANPVVVVLTVKNRPSLIEADEHLRLSWHKLTRRQAWKQHFRGGFVFWETTHNRATGWHAHLHILADGFMLKQELSDLWLSCTGDSFIVDISYIYPNEREEAVLEACKYPCKLSAIVEDPRLLTEYLLHIRGRRLFWAFGSCYGLSADIEEVEDQEDEEDQDEQLASVCPHCGTVGEMRQQFGYWWFMSSCERWAKSPWWVKVYERPPDESAGRHGGQPWRKPGFPAAPGGGE